MSENANQSAPKAKKTRQIGNLSSAMFVFYKRRVPRTMKTNRKVRALITVSCIAVLVGATLFAVVGQQESANNQVDTIPVAADKSASVGSLVGGLEARLASNPEDAKGWILLARSHDHLGNEKEAWNAYSRARELGMTDETLELKLAANMVGSLQQ
jgi:cytochrome c-type biogenesis protein CcmH